MLTKWLRARLSYGDWRGQALRWGVLGLFVLMTVQFVGCYIFNTFGYIDVGRFIHGYERLPFQTRLLLAPLFRWAETSPFMVRYASDLAMNSYFFPNGVTPATVVEFYLDIPCVLIAGFVAVRLYQSASRQKLLGWLVYPLFLVLCVVSYLLHTVQNFRFLYDMPSLAFFSVGLYLIYFRKSKLLLVALFVIATLNRETTLLLIPFYLLNEMAGEREVHAPVSPRTQPRATGGPLAWRPAVMPPARKASTLVRRIRGVPAAVWLIVATMLAYWAVWHVMVFHAFRHNASEYYSRMPFNFYCFRRLRYYPQLFSACGYLLPFLFVYRRKVHDAQLRMWMWAIPVWYALMAWWGILVETRVFGEMLPFIACITVLIAEEVLAAAVLRRSGGEELAAEERDSRAFRVA
jgi:hypothetical protein